MKSSVTQLLEKIAAGGEIASSELRILRDEMEHLQKTSDTYKHAFETTAADRDRIAAELARMGAEFHRMADPLDAGFFRFDFDRFVNSENTAQAQQLAVDWATRFDRGRYLEIIQSVLDNVPVKIALQSSEYEYKSLAAYYLASLMTRQMRMEEAARYAQHFYYTAPPEGTDFLQYDLKQASRLASWRRTRAGLRGTPGLLISSMPKSASAFLSDTLAELLQAPVMRTSIGDGLRALVIDRWAQEIAGGGAVTHEHFPAHPQNLAALDRAGISTLWLQVRDPRDCAYSAWKMRQNWFSDRNQQVTEMSGNHAYSNEQDVHFLTWSLRLSKWLSQWLQATADGKVRFKIEIITFDEVTTDLPNVLERVLGSLYTEEFEQLTQTLVSKFRNGALQQPNFRKGVGQEWRESCPDPIRIEVWNGIPGNVKEFLRLAE